MTRARAKTLGWEIMTEQCCFRYPVFRARGELTREQSFGHGPQDRWSDRDYIIRHAPTRGQALAAVLREIGYREKGKTHA